MKKKKSNTHHNEQQNNDDLAAIRELQDAWRKFDQIPIYSPDLHHFENLIQAEELTLKRKLIKDLLLFLLVAIVILTGVVISLFQMPVIFITLQVLSTIFIILYTFNRVTRKANSI